MKQGALKLTAGDLSGARKVAETFLQAVMRGDEAAARAGLILTEGESMDFKSMHESIERFELGEAKADGEVVVIVATVTAKPGQDAPPPLPLVLTRAGGTWKIDMGASITRMLGGVDLDGMMQQVAQGLGEAMAKGMEGLGEAMAQGLGAAAQDLMSAVGTREGTHLAPHPSKGKAKPAKKRTKGETA